MVTHLSVCAERWATARHSAVSPFVPRKEPAFAERKPTLIFKHVLRHGGLSQDAAHHIARDVRQSFVSTLMEVGQAFVIESHQMQDGRMNVV